VIGPIQAADRIVEDNSVQSEDHTAPLKILIADDSEDFLVPFQILLEALGYQVYSARSGSEVISLTQMHLFDALILSTGPGELNGCELANYLRSKSELAGVLLVALTGWGQPGIETAAMAAGFDHFFLKPVDFAKLERVLREAFR
jgi:CheY-like chemotaxis protein